MPLYDYRCPQGHFFEQMAPMAAARDRQDCPACGQASAKIPSRVSLGGQASAGLTAEQMPQTWRGTYEGNPEYVGQLRRQWEARQKLEDKYEELRGDRRPILAHEGRYHGAPLRAGDPVPPLAPMPGAAPAEPGAVAHPRAPGPQGHSHGPGPQGHSHGPGPQGHSHGPGPQEHRHGGASSAPHSPEPPTTL